MKPTRSNVFLIGEKYVLINRKMYRLELLDDEGMAEAFNGGDALPIMGQGVWLPDLEGKNTYETPVTSHP